MLDEAIVYQTGGLSVDEAAEADLPQEAVVLADLDKGWQLARTHLRRKQNVGLGAIGIDPDGFPRGIARARCEQLFVDVRNRIAILLPA